MFSPTRLSHFLCRTDFHIFLCRIGLGPCNIVDILLRASLPSTGEFPKQRVQFCLRQSASTASRIDVTPETLPITFSLLYLFWFGQARVHKVVKSILHKSIFTTLPLLTVGPVCSWDLWIAFLEPFVAFDLLRKFLVDASALWVDVSILKRQIANCFYLKQSFWVWPKAGLKWKSSSVQRITV